MKLTIAFADGETVGAAAVETRTRTVGLGAGDGLLLEASWTGTPRRLLLGCGSVMLGESYTTPDLGRMSMMPSYCWDRIPPQEVNGALYISGSYQKLPGVIWETKEQAWFLQFPSWVRINGQLTPTFYAISQGNGGGTLRLICPPSYARLRSTVDKFDRWEEGPLAEERVLSWSEPPTVKVELASFGAANLSELLLVLARAVVADSEVDQARGAAVTDRAAAFIAASTHRASGLIIEWKRRLAPGFRGVSLSLPLYHTGLADLRPKRDPTQARIHRGLVATFLHPSALVQTRWGPLWHNSATLRIPAGVKFFSHLGTGLAGYPGGSATTLRAVGEARRQGVVPASLWALATRVSHTVVTLREELGFWPLDVSAPDSGVGVGATAETAHALIEMGAHGDRRLLDTGLQVLADVGGSVDAGSTLSGYLRDNSVVEPDGVSWIALLAALVAAHQHTKDRMFERLANVAASGLTRWIRRDGAAGLDPVTYSFGPRIAPCEGFWAADALARAAQEVGSETFRDLAVHMFNTSDCEQDMVGFSEAVYLDHRGERHPHTFACVYTAFAALRAARYLGAREPRPDRWTPIGKWTDGLRCTHTWSRVKARLGQ